MDGKNKFIILNQITSKDIPIQFDNLNRMLEFIYKTQYFRNSANPTFKNERLRYVNLFSQKILLHGYKTYWAVKAS